MQSITISTIQNIIEKSQLAYPNTGDSAVIKGSEINIDDIFTTSSEERVLEETIAALSKEELAELAAIMWLGRGAGGETAADFDGLVNDALGQYKDSFADYISSKTPLADYLKNGLIKLGWNG
ncbi:DUF3775 domain-containing protein [Pseudoalteromonas sp. AOP7-A1-14]|uniref:DUF3775 domain-containing protein n=1 Tax=Pseudoalteromonas sp. AOP7-A1-14 TaxID=3457648 RepID=UPI00402B7C30